MKRLTSLLLVVLAVSLLTGIALAGSASDDQIGSPYWLCHGHAEMTYNYNGSTYTTTMTGITETYSSQAPRPQELYINLKAWDGNTFRDYITNTVRPTIDGLYVYQCFPKDPQTLTWYPLVPRVTGYHRAQWDAGATTDICSTVVNMTAGPAGVAAESVAVASDPWVMRAKESIADYGGLAHKGWTSATLVTSGSDLVELLGKESGVGLADLFNTALCEQYLNSGDKMPGLLVSPSGKDAVAVFFHADGSTAEVQLQSDQDGNWSIVKAPKAGANNK